MARALTLDSQRLATELYEVLIELDPCRWRDELATSMWPRIEQLREQIIARLAKADAHRMAPAVATLRERMSELAHLMEEALPRPDLQDSAMAHRWNDFRVRVSPAYERLAASLAHLEVHVPSLRPTNYTRNAFHVMNGMLCMFLMWAVLDEHTALLIASAAAACAWTCEVARRYVPAVNDLMMRLFRPVAHPHESWRVNSATWYCTALLAITLLYDLHAASVAVAVLGFADPAAAIIGRRFGRTPLATGRTLEGTATFVCVGTLIAWIWLMVAYSYDSSSALALALGGTIAGAVAELLSRRIDDNLTIPVAVALGVIATRAIVGI